MMGYFSKTKIRILVILISLVLSIAAWIVLIDAYPASVEPLEETDQTHPEEETVERDHEQWSIPAGPPDQES